MRSVFEIGELIACVAKARAHTAMPEDAPVGWSVHPADPGKVVRAFKGLRVNETSQLVAYQYSDGHGNGNAIVYALPRSAGVPLPLECPADEEHWLSPPRPPAALRDVRLAMGGDGSPWSYLAASIVYRDLREMGAAWHGASWSTHEFMDADPRLAEKRRRPRRGSRVSSEFRELEWHVAALDDWKPNVELGDAMVVARFVTYSALAPEQIVLHEDRFTRGEYQFETSETLLATGEGGYIY